MRRRVVLALALAVALLLTPSIGVGPRSVSGPVIGSALAPVVVPLLGPAPVAASCAALPSLEEALLLAEVAFVGSVTHLENDARWATVRVEERWRGARDLPDIVQVRGGPEPGTATSIDRVFGATRYLFVVRRGSGYLVDDACSATTAWGDDLARLRPPDITPAADVVAGTQVDELDLDAYLPLAAMALALIVAVIAYLVILRARRRPPDWLR